MTTFPVRKALLPCTLPKSANFSDLVEIGRNKLSKYQNTIVDDSMRTGSAGLYLPMNTGKSIISLVLGFMDSAMANSGIVLVVAQKILMTTWGEEINKFFGTKVKYSILHKEHVKNIEEWSIPTGTHVVLTTPEMISKAYKDSQIHSRFTIGVRDGFGPEVRHFRTPTDPYEKINSGPSVLFSERWGTLIIDEAQNYFNTKSDRCCGLAAICARRRWLLSGTMLAEPRINKLFGYYLLLNDPFFPRNLPAFTNYVTSPSFRGMKTTMVVREGNPDYVPPKINKVVVSHPLTQTEASIYTNMKIILNMLRGELQRHKSAGDAVNVKKFNSYIMAMISHMRQCLVAPLIPITHVAIEVSDVNARSELSEIFMKHINSSGLTEWLDDVNSLYSSRLKAVIEKINSHPSESVVVFSCFRTVLDVLKLYIDSNRPVFTISGGDKITKRQEIIDEFRKSKNGILLLTYDIGCNGLNLQSSSVVLLADLWWNAGKSKQAIARILRHGQQASEVTCYYFTSNTGMEKAILTMQRSKLKVGAEVMIGSINTEIEKIDVQEIMDLILQDDNIAILNDISS